MARQRYAFIGMAAAIALLALALAASPAHALDNGLARTPPMGWNGFPHFTRDVTADIVKQEARTLVASGMKDLGYEYVNLDGGWAQLQRDADGRLQANPDRFPDGIKPLADYVHSLGLKFGIYTSIGTTNCAGTDAGSYGHFEQDAETFASWGVDFVKADWCHVPLRDYPGMSAEQVARILGPQMRDALAATGRPMIFDYNINQTCPDECHVWEWAAPMANVWRMAYDPKDFWGGMLRDFLPDVPLYPYAGPGAWNDPGTLEVGNGGMSDTEYRSEFSLWAELAAPLLAGNDLSTMSDATRQILTNREIIAVDQDPLGEQGHQVNDDPDHMVFSKALADGDRAVVLFNKSDSPATISTTASAVGLDDAPAYSLRDLWRHDTTETAGTIAAALPAHGVAMYRVARDPGAPGPYPPHLRLATSSAAPWVVAGGSTTITATLTDDGYEAVTQPKLSLSLPAGWSATPLTPTEAGALAGGHSMAARWRVTAPADATGSRTLTASASYMWRDTSESESQGTPLAIAYPSLASAYDNAGTSDDSDVDAADFDGVGNSYSRQALAAAGIAPGATVSHGGIAFAWPDTAAGQPDNVVADGQTVALSGSGTKLAFLGASTDAPNATGSGTVYYADGSTSTYSLTLYGFWNKPPGTADDVIASMPYENSQGVGGRPRGQNPHRVYLFYASAPIDPGKTVSAVTLPSGGSLGPGRISGMHFFAAGVG